MSPNYFEILQKNHKPINQSCIRKKDKENFADSLIIYSNFIPSQSHPLCLLCAHSPTKLWAPWEKGPCQVYRHVPRAKQKAWHTVVSVRTCWLTDQMDEWLERLTFHLGKYVHITYFRYSKNYWTGKNEFE